jgi:hypothetical protein
MLSGRLCRVQAEQSKDKQSYFDRKWAATVGFDKNVDREDYTFDEVDVAAPSHELSRRIIDHFQMKPDEHVRDFVGRLTEQSLTFVAERRGLKLKEAEHACIIGQSARELMDNMFVFLYHCSAQLNSSLGMASLAISHRAPEYVTEVVRYTTLRQPIESVMYYRARLASPTWCLVLRSKDNRIELFVVPTTAVLGLSKTETNFKPLCTMSATIKDKVATWEIDGEPLTEESQREACMLAFKKLIDRTMEEIVIEDNDQFVLDKDPNSTTEE